MIQDPQTERFCLVEVWEGVDHEVNHEINTKTQAQVSILGSIKNFIVTTYS